MWNLNDVNRRFVNVPRRYINHCQGYRCLTLTLCTVREGDTNHVYALDRLGRDAMAVQAIVRRSLSLQVTLDINGFGPVGSGVGGLMVAVLAQIADMEGMRIKEHMAHRPRPRANVLARIT